MNKKVSSESVVKDIRRRTRKKYSSEEKIRIVLDGLRGEDSISSLCRREGIPALICSSPASTFLTQSKAMQNTSPGGSTSILPTILL